MNAKSFGLASSLFAASPAASSSSSYSSDFTTPCGAFSEPAPLFFSTNPQKTAVASAITTPTTCIGRSCLHSSFGSIPSTVAERMVGPPQGSRFITPIAVTQIRSSVVGRIFKRLYTGSIAGIVIRNVEAPPPSKCPIMAIIHVISATPTTLLPTLFINALMMRSNIPTSVIIPKKSTEKINNAAVECTPATPDAINSPISSTVNVPVATRITDVTVDTPANASAGTVTFLSNKTIIMMIVANPNTASIVSFIVCPLPFSLFLIDLL